jgi:hypothetical protein
MTRLIMLLEVMMMMGLMGCSSLPKDLLVNERRESERIAQRIIEALEEKDEDALRSLFSTRALAEADDLDEGLKYIMSVYKGSFITYENTGADNSNYFGAPGRTRMVKIGFEVTTDEEAYYLYFRYWLINEQDLSAEGLYMIKLDMLEALESESFMGGGHYDRPGIYHPGWDEDMARRRKDIKGT